MKVIFAGTPAFSVPALSGLLCSYHEIVAVYTQPDRPAGRGRQRTASPVKALALQHDVPVYQPENFASGQDIKQLAQIKADVMVVVAYGLLLPVTVLSLPRFGCLNIHASLLPRWRGAAPIQRAIQAGDHETGVTIMQIARGLDTGDILSKICVPILPDDTAGKLHDTLAEEGAGALQAVLDAIEAGNPPDPEPQDASLACYASKLSKAEARIDWCQDAAQIVRNINAFNPWPVAYTEFAGEALRVWCARIGSGKDEAGVLLSVNDQGIEVACGSGSVVLTRLQPAGKGHMTAGEFSRASQRQSQLMVGQPFGAARRGA